MIGGRKRSSDDDNSFNVSKVTRMSDDSDSQSPGQSSSMDIDNSSTVITKIANLYAERLMSDVCLVVGNVEYPSHRLILCASSDVFQVMLMNERWTESQEKRVVLGEDPGKLNFLSFCDVIID